MKWLCTYYDSYIIFYEPLVTCLIQYERSYHYISNAQRKFEFRISAENVLENLKFPYNSDSDWLSGVSCSVAKMENMKFPV